MSVVKGPRMKNALLDGSVSKAILTISVPVIFANVLQTVYQLIDTFWVGRLGTESVAAVSLSFPILFFLISFAMGIAMAGSILIAQYNGKGDSAGVSLAAGQTFTLVISLAVIFSVIGSMSSGYFLSFLTKDASVLEQATSYLRISFWAMSAMFIYNIFQSVMRGVGEVRVPMLIILGAVILNFFLDPLLMFGWGFIPGMGVAGVALATLITEYISAFIGVALLLSGRFGVRMRLSDLKVRLSWIKRLVVLGLPSSIEHSSRSLGMLLMMFIVSSFGTVVIAAYGIGTRVLSFVIIPSIGFSIATAALVGNNLGARKHTRAEDITRSGMWIAFTSLTLIGVLLFIFADSTASFFVPYEPGLVRISAQFIRVMALTFGFIGIQMVIIGTLKAAGKTTTSMFLALFHTVTLFALSYVLSMVLGLRELGLWLSYPIANVLAVLMAYYFYCRKDWLKGALV